jgi:hypothetical protein
LFIFSFLIRDKEERSIKEMPQKRPRSEGEESTRPSPMKVPLGVLKQVRVDKSCAVTEHDKDYFEVVFPVGSVGHRALIDWSGEGIVDPLVTVIVDAEKFSGGNAAAVQSEARSVVRHCAGLTAADIASGVPLPAPVPGAPMSCNIHHAKVALTFLLQCLAAPPPTYTAINSTPSANYLCTVQYAYRNSLHRTDVYKM